MIKIIIITMLSLSLPLHATDHRNYLRYFQANYTQFKGDHVHSKKWYHTIGSLLESPLIAKGHIHFLALTNDFSTIASLIPKLDLLFKNDAEIQMIFVKALMSIGDHKTAHKKIISLHQLNKSNPEIALLTAQIYIQQKDFKKALATINTALNNTSKKNILHILHFMKAQIYIAMDDKKAALQETKNSLALAPQFDKAWLLCAILEEESGNIPAAITAYTNFLEKTVIPNQRIQNHLIALTLQHNNNAQPTAKRTVSDLELALVLTKEKKYSQALPSLNAHLEKHPYHTQAKLLKAQLLTELNQKEELLTFLKNLIEQEPTMHVWFDLIYVLTKKNITPLDAIEILKNRITESNAHAILPLVYLSRLYSDIADDQNTLTTLQKLTSATNDITVKHDALLKIALLYKKQKNYAEMEKIATQGNELQQNAAPFLHLLSYANIKKGNIDEAKKLIKQALKLDKNNTKYLNQLAHVYEQKNLYHKAITVLEKALDSEPNNIKLLTHLTKIFTTQGLTNRAITTLTKALATTTNQQEKQALEQQLQALRVTLEPTTQQAMQDVISKI